MLIVEHDKEKGYALFKRDEKYYVGDLQLRGGGGWGGQKRGGGRQKENDDGVGGELHKGHCHP